MMMTGAGFNLNHCGFHSIGAIGSWTGFEVEWMPTCRLPGTQRANGLSTDSCPIKDFGAALLGSHSIPVGIGNGRGKEVVEKHNSRLHRLSHPGRQRRLSGTAAAIEGHYKGYLAGRGGPCDQFRDRGTGCGQGHAMLRQQRPCIRTQSPTGRVIKPNTTVPIQITSPTASRNRCGCRAPTSWPASACALRVCSGPSARTSAGAASTDRHAFDELKPPESDSDMQTTR